MDILRALRDGSITDDDAARIFEEAFSAFHRGEAIAEWGEYFELSTPEATAYMHGASWRTLARFRYGGWPEQCVVCGQPLDCLMYGWRVVGEPASTQSIAHIECPT